MKPNSWKGQGLVTDFHVLSEGGRLSQVTDRAKALGKTHVWRELGQEGEGSWGRGSREACGAAGQDNHGESTGGLHLSGTKQSQHGQKKTQHKSHPLLFIV